MKRIPFLDLLRVVACFMVMAIHAAEPLYLGGEAHRTTGVIDHKTKSEPAFTYILSDDHVLVKKRLYMTARLSLKLKMKISEIKLKNMPFNEAPNAPFAWHTFKLV